MSVDISTRQEQLPWFSEPVMIQQDWELINYIQDHRIERALLIGDSTFFQSYVDTAEHNVDFVVWIQNSVFKFDQLVKDINLVIDQKLNANGILYLAINKFLCVPEQYCSEINENYEEAILDYVKSTVLAQVVQYLPDRNHNGISFNWAHPLTRFYLKKTQ